MEKPKYHELGRLECDRAFIPAVESGLRMLKVWQKSVSDPKNASLEEFGDSWCSGAAAILSIVFAGVGQHLVVTKERTTGNFVVLELIEHRKPFIEPTAAGVLAALITELTRDVCREAKRVGLDVSRYGKWSKEEFKLLRVALGSLADIALRNDEIRKLKARVSREIMLVSGDPSETENSRVEPSDPDVYEDTPVEPSGFPGEDAPVEPSGFPGEDAPVEPSGFRWKGKEFSGLTPTAFRLLKFHWYRGTWKTRYFSEFEYRKQVFDDPDGTVGRKRVYSQQKFINRKFDESDILLHMTVEAERSFVREMSQRKFDERRKRRVKRKKKS